MKILLLGANGELGPWVVKALEHRHELRVTDVNDPPADSPHDWRRLDSSDLEGVVDAAAGMDMIVNLSVLRPDRKLAFDVNTRGNYNMMVAARQHGIRRVITTGPHFQLVGPQYESWDFDLNPEMPPAPGTRLYALSKSLGGEICRVFSDTYGIEVLTMLFYNMRHPDTLQVRKPAPADRRTPPHGDFTPFTVAWPDGGEAIRCAVEVESARLASRCETFFVFADLPHRKFVNEKTRQVLGWRPRYQLEAMWNKPWLTGEDT